MLIIKANVAGIFKIINITVKGKKNHPFDIVLLLVQRLKIVKTFFIIKTTFNAMLYNFC